MKLTRSTFALTAACFGVASLGAIVSAESPAPAAATEAKAPAASEKASEFLAPVQMKTGDKIAGECRYYPSPVFYDIDGDKVPELLIADLMGRITYAKRIKAEDGSVAYGEESKLLGKDKKDLKFSNW